jgi:hypothetical protein
MRTSLTRRRRKLGRSLLTMSFGLVPRLVSAAAPDCSGPDNWAASMAFVQLKNARILSNEDTDFSKTNVVRLASEQIGKDLYRQVHHVHFTEKTGHSLDVITMNNASHTECSMSGVEVFVVSRIPGR